MLQDQITELRETLQSFLVMLDDLEVNEETPEQDFGSLVDDLVDSVRYLN